MFAKRKRLTVIVAIMTAVFTVFLSSCTLFGGKLADEFPKLETIKIEKVIFDETSGEEMKLSCDFTSRQKAILKAGGLLAYTKKGE